MLNNLNLVLIIKVTLAVPTYSLFLASLTEKICSNEALLSEAAEANSILYVTFPTLNHFF